MVDRAETLENPESAAACSKILLPSLPASPGMNVPPSHDNTLGVRTTGGLLRLRLGDSHRSAGDHKIKGLGG